ncbi:hypothetical protein T4B_13364 [Trichinella pseudospiralis]|uniref:Uncharacterized protein n=1 Tax=Trichinella pseudospiralis TaxID=6337 RepID=A0A0V1IES6_TRIPS|nr:hypothetical protein T4B_13364 [Trichinella pseudospiralis]KRZ28019.1 hypothetical protein T4C_5716 [Trichinella pseudospiralis]
MSTLKCVSFRRKMLNNCSLFRNSLFNSNIAENPALHMYKVVEGGSSLMLQWKQLDMCFGVIVKAVLIFYD